MWTRADLKTRAKFAFKRNYWTAVLVAFVMTIFTAVGSGGNAAKGISDGYNSGGSAEAIAFSLVVAAIAAISGLVLLMLSIFVGNALEVGGCRFFITNQTEQANVLTVLRICVIIANT